MSGRADCEGSERPMTNDHRCSVCGVRCATVGVNLAAFHPAPAAPAERPEGRPEGDDRPLRRGDRVAVGHPGGHVGFVMVVRDGLAEVHASSGVYWGTFPLGRLYRKATPTDSPSAVGDDDEATADEMVATLLSTFRSGDIDGSAKAIANLVREIGRLRAALAASGSGPADPPTNPYSDTRRDPVRIAAAVAWDEGYAAGRAAGSGTPAEPLGSEVEPWGVEWAIGCGWSMDRHRTLYLNDCAVGTVSVNAAASVEAAFRLAAGPPVPDEPPTAAQVLAHVEAGGQVEVWEAVDWEEAEEELAEGVLCGSQRWVRIHHDFDETLRAVFAATAPSTPQPGLRLVPPETPGGERP